MKRSFNFNTLAMLFGVIALAALATWVVPGGEYRREVKNGRTLIVPESFAYVPSNPQGLGALLTSPGRGFVEAANIIVFCFIIGGAFSIIQKTGTITVAVQ